MTKTVPKIEKAIDRIDNFGLDVDSKKAKELSFAKELARISLISLKQGNSGNSAEVFQKYSREQIVKWLQNPASSAKNLRTASTYLYLSSMHYQRLIAYYAGLSLWHYTISPGHFRQPETDAEKEKLSKAYFNTSDLLETMTIPQTMREITTVLFREGVYYGVRWKDKNSFSPQRLSADICEIAYMSDGVYLFAVDMSKIDEKKIYPPEGEGEYYPAEFKRMFDDYKSTGVKLQMVPSEISVCLKADPSVQFSVPLFAALLPQLYRIQTSESRQDTSDALNNYKMLYGKLPVNEHGELKIDLALAKEFYTQISHELGTDVGFGMAPFEMEAITFEKSGTNTDIDIVQKTVSNFWQTSGSQPLLHGVNLNGSAGSLKLALKTDESYLANIIAQAERQINRILKTELSGSVFFKISFLGNTVFNIDDKIRQYKESASSGVAVDAYFASMGVKPSDIQGSLYVVNEILGIPNLLKPIKNSYTSSDSGEAGRPELDETELTESGENSKSGDTNANR